MSKFNWRALDRNDYEMLVGWWSAWGWPTPPSLGMLPADAFLVYNTETLTNVYAGFLYRTGTSIAWLEYVVSNKGASVDERRGGLEYLVGVVGTIAKHYGAEMLFSSTISPAFCQSLINTGFVLGDKNVNHLIKNL